MEEDWSIVQAGGSGVSTVRPSPSGSPERASPSIDAEAPPPAPPQMAEAPALEEQPAAPIGTGSIERIGSADASPDGAPEQEDVLMDAGSDTEAPAGDEPASPPPVADTTPTRNGAAPPVAPSPPPTEPPSPAPTEPMDGDAMNVDTLGAPADDEDADAPMAPPAPAAQDDPVPAADADEDAVEHGPQDPPNVFRLWLVQEEAQGGIMVPKVVANLPRWLSFVHQLTGQRLQAVQGGTQRVLRQGFAALDAAHGGLRVVGLLGLHDELSAALDERGMPAAARQALLSGPPCLALWVPRGLPGAAAAATGKPCMEAYLVLVAEHGTFCAQDGQRGRESACPPATCALARYMLDLCSHLVLLVEEREFNAARALDQDDDMPEAVDYTLEEQRQESTVAFDAERPGACLPLDAPVATLELRDQLAPIAASYHLDARSGSDARLLAMATSVARRPLAITKPVRLDLPRAFGQAAPHWPKGGGGFAGAFREAWLRAVGQAPPCPLQLDASVVRLLLEPPAGPGDAGVSEGASLLLSHACPLALDALRQLRAAYAEALGQAQQRVALEQAAEEERVSELMLERAWQWFPDVAPPGWQPAATATPGVAGADDEEMSAGEEGDGAEEARLRCPICFEDYAASGDHVPVSIACRDGAHVLCALCFHHLPGARPKCPICRRHVAGAPVKCLATVAAVEAAARERQRGAAARNERTARRAAAARERERIREVADVARIQQDQELASVGFSRDVIRRAARDPDLHALVIEAHEKLAERERSTSAHPFTPEQRQEYVAKFVKKHRGRGRPAVASAPRGQASGDGAGAGGATRWGGVQTVVSSVGAFVGRMFTGGGGGGAGSSGGGRGASAQPEQRKRMRRNSQEMSSHPDVLRVACNEVALESLKRLRRQQDADRPRLVAAALALPWDEEHMRALVVRPLEAALSDALGAPAAAPPPGPVAPAATIDDIKFFNPEYGVPHVTITATLCLPQPPVTLFKSVELMPTRQAVSGGGVAGTGTGRGSQALFKCYSAADTLVSCGEGARRVLLLQAVPGSGDTRPLVLCVLGSDAAAGPHAECCTRVLVWARGGADAARHAVEVGPPLTRAHVEEAVYEGVHRQLFLLTHDRTEVALFAFDKAHRQRFERGRLMLDEPARSIHAIAGRKELLVVTASGRVQVWGACNCSRLDSLDLQLDLATGLPLQQPQPAQDLMDVAPASPAAAVATAVANAAAPPFTVLVAAAHKNDGSWEGTMLLVLRQASEEGPGGGSGGWALDAYSLEVAEAGAGGRAPPRLTPLRQGLPLPLSLRELPATAQFKCVLIQDVQYLMALAPPGSAAAAAAYDPSRYAPYQPYRRDHYPPPARVLLEPLDVTCSVSWREARRAGGAAAGAHTGAGAGPAAALSASDSVLELLAHVFHKFAGDNAFGLHPFSVQASLWGRVGSGVGGLPASTSSRRVEAMNAFAQQWWEQLRGQALLKPFATSRLWFSPDAPAGFGAPLPAFGVGAWLLRAMTLCPTQICRCEGGHLVPMSDGLPHALRADEVTDITEAAKSIRLGLYEAVLNAFAHLPVYVVTVAGETSMGKSFLLNHTFGSFFDVAGGRCTDGCWMTARVWRNPETGADVLLVLLDVEGLGSLERTEREDMLLSILTSSVSSLTLFRNHLSVSRYTEKMMDRFGEGVSKVKAMTGALKCLFTGKICFVLKDVQPASARDVQNEFVNKVASMQSRAAGADFITNMFPRGYSVAPYPNLTGTKFYSMLERFCRQVSAHLREREQAQALERARAAQLGQPERDVFVRSGPHFLAALRTLVAKIAFEDWTPVDKDQARALVATVLRLLPRVAATGRMRVGVSGAGGAAAAAADEEEDEADVVISAGTDGQLLDLHQYAPVTECPTVSFTTRARKPDGAALPAFTSAAVAVAPGALPAPVDEGGEGEPPQGWCDVDVVVTLADAEEELPPLPVGPGTLLVAGEQRLAAYRRLLRAWLDVEGVAPLPATDRLAHGAARLNLDRLVQALVARRAALVQEWMARSIKPLAQVVNLSLLEDPAANLLSLAAANGKLCGELCGECMLRCALPAGHDGEHGCGTAHKCEHACVFCAANHETQACDLPAGHTGRHVCSEVQHLCGRPCDLAEQAGGCQAVCALQPGHAGDHRCASLRHTCKHACTAPSCTHTCGATFGEAHATHVCAQPGLGCLVQCQLCHRKCASADHAHGLDAAAVHLCGAEHRCQQPCAAGGLCSISTHLHRDEQRTLDTGRGRITYTYKARQVAAREQCCRVVPAGRLQHDGPHVHSEEASAVHYCGARCPTCAYMCSAPHGHAGPHNAEHGNMENTRFVSNTVHVDVEDRLYVRGNPGVAECCDAFCRACGRGHVHVLPHDARAVATVAGRRRARVVWTNGDPGDAALPRDELTHDCYWATVGWAAPGTAAQLAEYRKCGAACGSEEHQNDAAQNVPRCELPMWHAPLSPDQPLPPNVPAGGYVSAGGHYFRCSHATACAAYIAVDVSGSMTYATVLPQGVVAARGAPHHQNRLGLALEAAHAFLTERLQRCQDDALTYITFDHEATVRFANAAVADATSLLDNMLATSVPDGGTVFHAALECAFNCVQSDRQQGAVLRNRRPVVILITDSEDGDVAATRHWLAQAMAQEQSSGLAADRRVVVHVLGVGNRVNTSYVQELARIGNGVAFVGHDAGLRAGQLHTAMRMIAERPDRMATLVPTS